MPMTSTGNARTACRPRLAGVFGGVPRHVDLTWATDRNKLDLNVPAFTEAIADLAATIHGVPKEEMLDEDLRQHRRTRRMAAGAIVGLVA